MSSILADRYGRRGDQVRTRRRLIAALVVFVVLAVGFAAWVAVERSRTALTWTELGITVPSDDSATVTFQVDLPAGAQAVCTVRVVNEVRTEVGRRDVVLGPSSGEVIRTEVRLRTSERASAGGVRDCVRR